MPAARRRHTAPRARPDARIMMRSTRRAPLITRSIPGGATGSVGADQSHCASGPHNFRQAKVTSVPGVLSRKSLFCTQWRFWLDRCQGIREASWSRLITAERDYVSRAKAPPRLSGSRGRTGRLKPGSSKLAKRRNTGGKCEGAVSRRPPCIPTARDQVTIALTSNH
jgi:hypothetical protein